MKAKIEGSEDDYQDQVDLAGNIIPTLYEALGEDQSDESKKIKLAQIRAAIGTALYKHFTAPVVAEALVTISYLHNKGLIVGDVTGYNINIKNYNKNISIFFN